MLFNLYAFHHVEHFILLSFLHSMLLPNHLHICE
jgi:hypothetical protein